LNTWDALTTINHLKHWESTYLGEEEEKMEEVVPFVACGVEELLDADMNYSLGQGEYLGPRQEPIDPPYKAFLEKRNELNN
jgi:hypothetical protein